MVAWGHGGMAAWWLGGMGASQRAFQDRSQPLERYAHLGHLGHPHLGYLDPSRMVSGLIGTESLQDIAQRRYDQLWPTKSIRSHSGRPIYDLGPI